MSVYSTSLKAEVYEARQFNQQRCEFRLDKGNTIYYTNLRLVGVGVQGAGANDVYNEAAGAYALVKSVRLMDGGIEIDRCDEANRYLAWKNQLSNNEDNRHINQRLSKNSVGYRLNASAQVQTNPAVDKATPVAGDNAWLKERRQAWLDLRACLPVLNSMVALDTELMKNVRILIEWETDARKIVKNSTNSGALTVQQPILVCDEVRDPSLASKLRGEMKSFAWKTYEHDQVNIPAQTALPANGDLLGTLQQTTRTVNGFDNKYVHRIVMMKSMADKTKNIGNGSAAAALNANVGVGFGDFRSQAQHLEAVQFQLNGSNLLTGNGLDSPALKADLHDQTWGSLNMVPYGHLQSVGLDQCATGGNVAAGVNNHGVNVDENGMGSGAKVGQSDYIGLRLEERINDFQLKYERRCLLDVTSNLLESSELEVHFFAEVPKSFSMDGKGSYTIAYL